MMNELFPKTEKLYDADAYASEFSARVLACEAHAGGSAVVLDRTLFFPEEGGQSCDTGTLGGMPVARVEKKDGVIRHLLERPAPFAPGDEISGRIDFAPRYRKMQNHSGEHIVSGLVFRLLGLRNVGFHLGKTDVTMDYDGLLSDADADRIEDAANEAVYRNLEITAKEYEKESDIGFFYRSKIALDGPVRIVTVGDVDVCACCAPHVRRTGEIGVIKLTDVARYKGGVRVHLLCGGDALADYRRSFKQIRDISALLSAKREGAADAVHRLYQENGSLAARLSDAVDRLCAALAARLPVENDGRCALLFVRELPEGDALRRLACCCAERAPACAVFLGADGAYRFAAAGRRDCVAPVFALLSERFSAKGGGSEDGRGGMLYQGVVRADEASLRGALESISF